METKNKIILILIILLVIAIGISLNFIIRNGIVEHDKQIAQDTATLLNQLIFQAIQQQGYIQLGYNNQTLILVPYKQ